MSYSEIWETLSAIDTTAHQKEKGKLTYLPWAMAWSLLMKEYPEATFEFLPEATLDNGTVECCAVVTIGECQRSMWLPVMDYKNASIEKPTSREISDSRMRTLVKTLALFGLGISLYRGLMEDVPDNQDHERLIAHNNALRDNLELVMMVKSHLFSDDYNAAYGAWADLSTDEMGSLWISTTKGGIFSTDDRKKMKSNDWNDARKAYHNLEDEQ